MLIPGIRLVERPGALFFIDGRRVVRISGDPAACAAIQSTLSDGAAHLSDEAAGEIHAMLERLQLCVDDGPSPVELQGVVAQAVAYASASTAGQTTVAQAADRLDETVVYVFGDPTHALKQCLVESGLLCETLTSCDEIARLDPALSVVVAVASPDRPAASLAPLNAACVQNGVTWLPLGAHDGAVMHVGPLIIPSQTACYECLLRRLAANVEYADVYRDVVADAPAAPTPPGLRDIGRSIASLVLLRWITCRDARLPGRLFSVDVDQLRVDQSMVFRVPRCAACAAPDYTGAAAPWEPARDH